MEFRAVPDVAYRLARFLFLPVATNREKCEAPAAATTGCSPTCPEMGHDDLEHRGPENRGGSVAATTMGYRASARPARNLERRSSPAASRASRQGWGGGGGGGGGRPQRQAAARPGSSSAPGTMTTNLEAGRGWQRRQKAVAVLLLALAVDFQTRHAAAAFVCPQGCSCQPGDELVSCVGLTTVPRYFGRSPKVLKITQHRITKLSSKSFRGLERLEELEISDGRLFEISDDAFSSLRHLRAVNLSHNELSLVPRDAFAACARLEQLDLSWNPLVLPSRGAALASPSLAALDVSSCGLSRLPERALALLPALSELRLRDNGLRQVSACALPPDHRLVLLDVDPGVEWLACAPQPEVSTAGGRGRPAREQPPPGDHWLGLAQLALVPSLEQWVFLTVAALVVVLLLACIRRACKPEERPKEHMYEILGGNQAAHLPVAPYTDLRISRISTSTCETFGDSARVSMADGESRQYLPNYFPTVPASQS